MKNNENIFTSGRRRFLKYTSAALIGGTLAHQIGFAKQPASTEISNTLKVGLIGCGGRGAGAAGQALQADPHVVLTAMADIFPDRLDESYRELVAKFPEKVKVDKKYDKGVKGLHLSRQQEGCSTTSRVEIEFCTVSQLLIIVF